jgi:hypothetical protein
MDEDLAGIISCHSHPSAMLSSVPATYKLVYAFLIKHSHSNVARALKEAAKDIVILKDDAKIEMKGSQLERIVKEWNIRGLDASTDAEDSERSSSLDFISTGFLYESSLQRQYRLPRNRNRNRSRIRRA